MWRVFQGQRSTITAIRLSTKSANVAYIQGELYTKFFAVHASKRASTKVPTEISMARTAIITTASLSEANVLRSLLQSLRSTGFIFQRTWFYEAPLSTFDPCELYRWKCRAPEQILAEHGIQRSFQPRQNQIETELAFADRALRPRLHSESSLSLRP
ncbi:hypothetical protein D3C87_1342170 [compost metagenome]